MTRPVAGGDGQVPLAGRGAVVTGGGSGIKRATVESLARGGADVMIADTPILPSQPIRTTQVESRAAAPTREL